MVAAPAISLGWFLGPLSFVFAVGALVFLLKARAFLRHELRSVIDYSILGVFVTIAWGMGAGTFKHLGLISEPWAITLSEILSAIAVFLYLLYGYFLLKWAQKQAKPLFAVPENNKKKKR